VSRRTVVLAGLAVALLATACSSGDDERSGDRAPQEPDLEACAAIADAEAARDCYAQAFSALMRDADDPGPALEEIAAAAYTDPSGRLLGDCHGLMHTVGREYAVEHGVTLESLMTYLPQTNEPGCSAGFAHGLVTAVAPEIDLSDPRASARVCDEAQTRYRRYSCVHGFGHAFMRLVREDLDAALELCSALGPDAPDCSQGAFHDYWFAVAGADDAPAPEAVVEDPRELCGASPRSSFAPAGTARSSRTGRRSRSSRAPTSSASAKAWPACSVRAASRPRRWWGRRTRTCSSPSAPSWRATRR
jgi:hypothetical protein